MADTYVWDQFRLHLNVAMLQMTLLGSGQVVSFSWKEIIEIAGLVVLCFLFGFVLTWLAKIAALKFKRIKLLTTCLVGLFVLTNIIYGVGYAKQDMKILLAAEIIPVQIPFTFNTFLVKYGFMTEKEIAKSLRTASPATSMQYPLHPLNCHATKPLNIVLLAIDGLRADELTPEIMPNTWDFAQSAIRFTDHWSGGIATQTGIFSLFTGLPASYWKSSLYSKTPSVLIQALEKEGYKIGTFTGAPLNHPEFDKTIFAGIKDLHLVSWGRNTLERDKNAEVDFTYWARKIPKDEHFFAFIFLNNVHDHEFPEAPGYEIFKPYLKEVNYLNLSHTDPLHFLNRNKNAAHYADEAIGRMLNFLKQSHLLENTVVIITSDHGNEFNDTGQNYWNHNGNFTKYQAQVPLVIWWPGKKPEVINYRTSGLDIVPTILPEILGCENPTSDYSVGRSLWDSSDRPFVYSSTYGKHALIEPERVVVIDEKGVLKFVDNNNVRSSDTSIPPYMSQVMEESTRYLKK